MADDADKLYFLTMRQAGELLRAGELSPVELLRACLDRIADTDGRLHSFVTLTADDAMAQARTAEAEMLRGEYRGPMHGIPFALKDLYDTAGIRTTSGSYVDLERVPQADATETTGSQNRPLPTQAKGNIPIPNRQSLNAPRVKRRKTDAKPIAGPHACRNGLSRYPPHRRPRQTS